MIKWAIKELSSLWLMTWSQSLPLTKQWWVVYYRLYNVAMVSFCCPATPKCPTNAVRQSIIWTRILTCLFYIRTSIVLYMYYIIHIICYNSIGVLLLGLCMHVYRQDKILVLCSKFINLRQHRQCYVTFAFSVSTKVWPIKSQFAYSTKNVFHIEWNLSWRFNLFAILDYQSLATFCRMIQPNSITAAAFVTCWMNLYCYLISQMLLVVDMYVQNTSNHDQGICTSFLLHT